MIVRHVLSNWIVHASYTSTARKLADADTDAFLDYDPGLHQTQGNHKEPECAMILPTHTGPSDPCLRILTRAGSGPFTWPLPSVKIGRTSLKQATEIRALFLIHLSPLIYSACNS
jgi:hypothetical protein